MMSERIHAKFTEARRAFTPVPRAMALVWDADPKATLGMAALTLVSALLPVSQAWLAKLIVDSVLHSVSMHHTAWAGLWAALPYLSWEFGLIVVGSALTQLRALLEQILDHKLGYRINVRIIRKALALDLHHFESSEFHDKMRNARQQAEYRALAIMNAGFLLAQNVITLLSFTALLLAASPWIAVLLFGATLPAFIARTRYSRLNFRLQSWRAPETRKMSYLEQLLTEDWAAKEVKLFALGEPLLKRHAELFWKTFREDEALAWRRSGTSLAWGLLANLSYYVCYAWIILKTLDGVLTLGGMTMYLALFRQSQGTFAGLFDNVNKLFENGLFMENLFSFLGIPEATPPARPAGANPGTDHGIEFQNVSFRYNNQESWALRNVSFRVEHGEKIAIVGENGSGKTTMMKLLTRLYQPTEGTIRLDGRDLRDYQADELHRKIGIIFQDFVRYQTTLRDNVGFGSFEHLTDDDRIEKAASSGGGREVVDALPDRWDTMLGGWFQKGRELSGGQWQKVALSRAFMRDGEVIVLDEPTSALDAEKEYEIFRRFKELTDGKTAFLISHRFSTVRMADRIIVLRQGEIEEMGSHADLIARQGTYARLFELQAEGYR
jgi:ATP-binding cassette, subfamily B, bacterial